MKLVIASTGCRAKIATTSIFPVKADNQYLKKRFPNPAFRGGMNVLSRGHHVAKSHKSSKDQMPLCA